MSGKKDKASAEDLHVMDTVEQYETYEDYLDSQVYLYWSREYEETVRRHIDALANGFVP